MSEVYDQAGIFNLENSARSFCKAFKVISIDPGCLPLPINYQWYKPSLPKLLSYLDLHKVLMRKVLGPEEIGYIDVCGCIYTRKKVIYYVRDLYMLWLPS